MKKSLIQISALRLTILVLVACLLLVACGKEAPIIALEASSQPMASEEAYPMLESYTQAVPDYLKALSDMGDKKVSEDYSLTILRGDKNIKITTKSVYQLKKITTLLTSMNMRPALEGEDLTTDVAYPVTIILDGLKTGTKDVYQLTGESMKYNSVESVIQNPRVFTSHNYLGYDLLAEELFTVGELIPVVPENVLEAEYTLISQAQGMPTALLRGKDAQKAVGELLGYIVRRSHEGDTPIPGGGDSYRILLKGNYHYRVDNLGVIYVDGKKTGYHTVWCEVPPEFKAALKRAD